MQNKHQAKPTNTQKKKKFKRKLLENKNLFLNKLFCMIQAKNK